MKKLLIIVLGVCALAAAWGFWERSVKNAYRRGFVDGGREERDCWVIDPAKTTALIHGEITARRDTTAHPLLNSHLAAVTPAPSINSIPARFAP
jgi:hypothetical protein